MKPKRKVVLLSLGGVLGTLLLGAVSGAGKMLGTDLWPSLRPFVSTVGTFTLAVFAWFAQPVTFPLWSHIVAVLVVVGVIGTLIYITASLMEELSKANAKLNPTLPPLDDNAQQVLAVIAKCGGQDGGLYLSDLPKMVGLPHLLFEAGMDSLYHWNLFSTYQAAWGDQITLSARGRAYILHPESPLAWLVKSA